MHVDLLLDPFGARWSELRDAAQRRRRRRVPGDLDLRPPRRTGVRRRPRARVLDDAERARRRRAVRRAGSDGARTSPTATLACSRRWPPRCRRCPKGASCSDSVPAPIRDRPTPASKRRSGDPCSATPSDASRSSSAWRSCVGHGAHRGSCVPIPNLPSSSPPSVRRWPRSPGVWGTASTHERAIPACASWSRPPAERAAILSAFSSPCSRTSTSGGCHLPIPDAGTSTSSAPQRLILAMTAPPDRRRIAAVAPLLAG